jgi:hypothetical protein
VSPWWASAARLPWYSPGTTATRDPAGGRQASSRMRIDDDALSVNETSAAAMPTSPASTDRPCCSSIPADSSA